MNSAQKTLLTVCRIIEEKEVQILVDEDWDENLLNHQANRNQSVRLKESFVGQRTYCQSL